MVIRENSTDLPRVRLSYVKQRKRGGGFKTVRKYRPKRYYHGRPVNLPFKTTRPGRYRIIVRTNFKEDSQFRDCRDRTTTFRVAARRPSR